MLSINKHFDAWKKAHGVVPDKRRHPVKHCAFKQFNAMTGMIPERTSSYPRLMNVRGEEIPFESSRVLETRKDELTGLDSRGEVVRPRTGSLDLTDHMLFL